VPKDIENAQGVMCFRQLMEGKGDPELIRQATYYYTHESYQIKMASTFDYWLLRHGSDEIELQYQIRMGPDGNVPFRPLREAKFKKFRQKHHANIALLYAWRIRSTPKGDLDNRPIFIRAGLSGRVVNSRAALQELYLNDELPTPVIHATNAEAFRKAFLEGGKVDHVTVALGLPG